MHIIQSVFMFMQLWAGQMGHALRVCRSPAPCRSLCSYVVCSHKTFWTWDLLNSNYSGLLLISFLYIGKSDPYISIQAFPFDVFEDSAAKTQQTGTKKKDLNPVYMEMFHLWVSILLLLVSVTVISVSWDVVDASQVR